MEADTSCAGKGVDVFMAGGGKETEERAAV
jgi:hypothetical protein